MDLKEFIEARGFDPLTEDPPKSSEGPLTRNERLNIRSGGHLMNGLALMPQGRGPHPAVLFLHGFPGHETNLDIAHALRRAGFACFLFHYRGSWGSEGAFSFGNMVEDALCALEHLDELSHEMDFSGKKLVLGFSMGAWAAAMALADRKDVHGLIWLAGANLGPFKFVLETSKEAREKAMRNFADSLGPLRGTSVDALLDEVIDRGEGYDLCQRAEDLKGIPVLMIKASRDATAVPIVHFEPFLAALKEAQHPNLEVVILDADHNFTGTRLELARYVVDWCLRTIFP